MLLSKITNARGWRLYAVASIGVFLFFAPMLSVPRGYTVGAVILLVAGLVLLIGRPPLMLSHADKLMLWLMTGLFAVGVFSYVHHGNPIRSLDLVSRYLMAVPVFILLVHQRPKAEWLWAGVIVGCLTAAGVTILQKVVLNLPCSSGRSTDGDCV